MIIDRFGSIPLAITIDSPTNYEIYPADSGEVYSFYTTDNKDPNPEVTATVTDFKGVIDTVASSDDLPTTSGLYTLTVTATDNAGNSA